MERKLDRLSKLPKWLLVILIPLWACGIYYLTQLLIAIIFRLILPKESLSSPIAQSIYSLISSIVALAVIVVVPFLLIKSWKTSRKELGLLGLPKWTDIGLAPVGYIVYLILSYTLFSLFSNFSWFNPSENQDVGYNFSLLFGVEKYFALFIVLVVAPVVEEVIFRGFVYGKLKKNLPLKGIWPTVIATLITSLSFAIMHGQWNVGVDVFALSVVLCIQREISGSIYPCILTHIIKNTLAVIVLMTLF